MSDTESGKKISAMTVDIDMIVGLLVKAVVTISETIATRIKAYTQYESARAVILPCVVNVGMKMKRQTRSLALDLDVSRS